MGTASSKPQDRRTLDDKPIVQSIHGSSFNFIKANNPTLSDDLKKHNRLCGFDFNYIDILAIDRSIAKILN